jgi:hypothetical protein
MPVAAKASPPLDLGQAACSLGREEVRRSLQLANSVLQALVVHPEEVDGAKLLQCRSQFAHGSDSAERAFDGL